MGIEALSRGARRVVFLDNSRQAQEIIKIFRTASRFDYAMVAKDYAGVERVVKIGF